LSYSIPLISKIAMPNFNKSFLPTCNNKKWKISKLKLLIEN
jgi:hypothetical protein